MGASSSKDPCEIAYNNIFDFDIQTGPNPNMKVKVKTQCDYKNFIIYVNRIPLDKRPDICKDLETIYSDVDKKKLLQTTIQSWYSRNGVHDSQIEIILLDRISETLSDTKPASGGANKRSRYEKRSMNELRALANERKIKNVKNLTKEKLIEKIRQYNDRK